MSDKPFDKGAKIRRGECDDEMPDYDVIVSWILRCPKTWLGGLLRVVVHRCVLEPFFKDDEALKGYVNRVVEVARDPNSVLRSYR